jgi:hypothetical protein
MSRRKKPAIGDTKRSKRGNKLRWIITARNRNATVSQRAFSNNDFKSIGGCILEEMSTPPTRAKRLRIITKTSRK